MFDLLNQAKALPHRHVRIGDIIYSRGDSTDGNIYIVLEGEISEYRKIRGEIRAVRNIYAGQFIGDIEVMASHSNRLKSYLVKSSFARLAILEKQMVTKLGAMFPEFFLILLKSSIDNLQYAEFELVNRKITV